MDGELAIRAYVDSDFAALTELWHETNRSAYPYIAAQQEHTLDEARAYFRSSVLANDRVWVASLNGTLVGLIAASSTHITQLAVAIGYQRRGIGSACSGTCWRAPRDPCGSSPSSATQPPGSSTRATAFERCASASVRRRKASPTSNISCPGTDLLAGTRGREGQRQRSLW